MVTYLCATCCIGVCFMHTLYLSGVKIYTWHQTVIPQLNRENENEVTMETEEVAKPSEPASKETGKASGGGKKGQKGKKKDDDWLVKMFD